MPLRLGKRIMRGSIVGALHDQPPHLVPATK
jgi:hypothetical protein